MPSADQLRATVILAFRDELARLESDGVLRLDETTSARVRRHHDTVLSALAAGGEVDLTTAATRLSVGMRITTLLGTVALAAAYALFVGSHWAALSPIPQLALIVGPPIVLVALTHFAAGRERSGYVASLMATVAIIAFLTNLMALGELKNLPDSRGALVAVGLFALVLAYGYRLTGPLLIGIGGVFGWCWSLGAIPLGVWWREGFSIMEPLALVGAAAMFLSGRLPGPPAFAAWWRGVGAAAVVVALLFLGSIRAFSGLAGWWSGTTAGYQILGAVILPLLAAWGVKRDDRPVTWIGTAGVIVYLFLRLFDWFWRRLPNWGFFLLVGAFALAVFAVLKRLHRARTEPR